MKEVCIILRPKMYFKTKEALDKAGFSSLSVHEVIGRGKKAVQYEADGEIMIHRLVAKRMITMFVRNEDVDFLIETVRSVNGTNHAGDGKIFILPVLDAIRIRTGEHGEEAIM